MIQKQNMNFQEFRERIDILLDSSVKAVSWKVVAQEVGVSQNTVLKYVHAQDQPLEPNLELCKRIYISAYNQLKDNISILQATSQKLSLIA